MKIKRLLIILTESMSRLNIVEIIYHGHTDINTLMDTLLYLLLTASRNISDGHTTVDNQEFVVTRYIGHNHDMEGNSIPIYGRRRLKGDKWVTFWRRFTNSCKYAYRR